MKNKLSHISKKSRMIAATAFVLGIVAMDGSFAYADTTQTIEKNRPMDSIVNAIATKFNLNSSEVQTVVSTVMESERSARETQGKVDQATRIAEAVIDGKITQTQADLISSKLSELKTSREVNQEADKNLTQEERQAKMKEERENTKEWATNNNIPMNFLQPRENRKAGFGGLENHKRNDKTSTID